jgi:DNA-binding NtrC family response regulator
MPGTQYRVLVVDDDPDVLESLQMMLEDSFQVTVASGGLEALSKVSATAFDAIVLDLMMPDIDGGAVIQELRKRSVTTPVILLSAVSDLRQRARQLDVFDAEPKPIDIERLQRTIERAIES